MNSEIKKQICDLIKNSASPLILIPDHPNIEAMSGALSFFSMFKKTGKTPQVVCSAPLADKFLFLPEAKSISRAVSNEAVYKVAIDVAKNDLRQVSYDQENDFLNIYLTVKKGKIKIDSVALGGAKFKYDLIVVLNFSSLNSLGENYLENKELFSNIPVINIDCRAANERFGAVNLIEASPIEMTLSIAEIVKNVLPSGLEEKIATLLLASIISATDNFQAFQIDSKIFSLTASLIDSGAKREEIMKHLSEFKTGGAIGAAANEAAKNIAGDILKKKSEMQTVRVSR